MENHNHTKREESAEIQDNLYEEIDNADNHLEDVHQEHEESDSERHPNEDLSNDEILAREPLSSLVDQGEGLVYYEVQNIYKNEVKQTYVNRMKLKRNPPILVIRDDDDNEVRFELTENLTNEMIRSLKEVKRAYHGFSGPEALDKPDNFLGRVKYYCKKNPFKIMTAIFLILFILSLNVL